MKKILCLIGLHKWEISKYTIRKGKRHQIIVEEGFERDCSWCDKRQRLEQPKEYHPCKYVWTNKNQIL